MTVRRAVQLSLNPLVILTLVFLCSPLLAQQAEDEIANAKFQATGAINANAVFVRSGPSENDYPTLRLDKGQEVTVIGERFNWLKIVPPDGSFCYVAKAYVNRTGNGNFGQVTSTLNVRMGSALNSLKTKVTSKLEPNERVEIIGEQDEYFKIKPPQDVYLYVNKQYVDFVKLADGAGAAVAGAGAGAVIQDGNLQPANQELAGGPAKPDAAPTSQPSDKKQEAAAPPASQPTADAQAQFEQCEKTYAEITQRPLDEQPIEQLMADYQRLSTDATLPESMQRICEYKVGVLKGRSELKAQYAEVKKIQEEMKGKQVALRAEQGELEQRIKDNELQSFTAVGTLRTSSLQQGQQTMYRLTDPANGRTVVYLRSDDTKLGGMIGQFIGVKGEVTTEPAQNLKFIAPTSFEVVNPAKLGQSVVTQLAPPSMMPGATASSDSK